MNPFDKDELKDWLLVNGTKSSFNTSEIEIAWTSLDPWLKLGLDKVNYSITLTPTDYIEILGKSSGIAFPLKGLLEHGKLLGSISNIPGFDTFIESFKNPEQFFDTLFEVRCIHFCYTKMNGSIFEISPKILKNGKNKFPDFKFSHNGVDFFCECKSLETINRGKTSRALKLIDEIKKDLQPLFGKGFRMEVAFDNLPPHWNRNFGNQLFGAFGELIKKSAVKIYLKMNIAHNHKIITSHIAIARFTDEPIFRGLSVGDVPGPDGRKSNLLVTEFLNSKKDIKKTIQDASTQLPDNELSIVFINPLDQAGFNTAVKDFLTVTKTQGPNLISIAEERGGSFTFKINPKFKDMFIKLLK